jgi:hypothetical protein
MFRGDSRGGFEQGSAGERQCSPHAPREEPHAEREVYTLRRLAHEKSRPPHSLRRPARSHGPGASCRRTTLSSSGSEPDEQVSLTLPARSGGYLRGGLLLVPLHTPVRPAPNGASEEKAVASPRPSHPCRLHGHLHGPGRVPFASWRLVPVPFPHPARKLSAGKVVVTDRSR